MRFILYFFALTAVAALGGFFGMKAFIEEEMNKPVGGADQKIIYQVTAGSSWKKVTQDLEQNGFIGKGRIIYEILRWGPRFSLIPSYSLKVGEYELHSQMTVKELLEKLSSGRGIEYKITFPEGLNLWEVAQILESHGLLSVKEFLKKARDPSEVRKILGEPLESLEGYLYPDTYAYTRETTGWALVTLMVRRFQEIWEKNFQGRLANLGWSRHQVITLASIVEKETGAPWERPLIAGVFFNRLERRMKLQTDPTVLYAKALQQGFWELNIRRSDLSLPHPYNTYYRLGLPPGPIANPGKMAIQAVFEPQRSEFLYFVSMNDGTHVFSKTLDEHNAAVRRYQLDAKAREGKSWRDLKNRLQESSSEGVRK